MGWKSFIFPHEKSGEIEKDDDTFESEPEVVAPPPGPPRRKVGRSLPLDFFRGNGVENIGRVVSRTSRSVQGFKQMAWTPHSTTTLVWAFSN